MQFTAGGVSSKIFLKLTDGESVVGVFRGDPHHFKQHWMGNNRSQPCLGDGCDECKNKKPGFRFRVNLITKENETYLPKIFESNWTVYQQMKCLHEGDYNLEKTKLRITRHGTGTQTTYTLVPIPSPSGVVTPELEKTLTSIKLHDLVNLKEQAPSSDSPPLGDLAVTAMNLALTKQRIRQENRDAVQASGDMPF